MIVKFAGASRNALTCAMSWAALAAAPAAAQQVIVISSGTTDIGAKTVGGTDSITVEAGGTLAPAANPAINWSTASSDLRITNSGTITSTANGGRAINASGGNNVRNVRLVNNVGGVITSQDDAFRINVTPLAGSIIVDNYGVIRTTNGGQALDFDAIGEGVQIRINNYAGAELRSFGQDAIRPGLRALVTNAGLIYSDGAANNNYDGIDWQGRNGAVVNEATGTISGLRHGITSDVAVDVTNRGTIVGRNGSGVGSDGTGTVVNIGTITGQWDGIAINGDGDGIDIDRIGSVTNSGIIQGLSAAGVDSGGRANSAEGVAMGGGTIVNNAGGLIYGAGTGILVNHDTNPGGVADGATTITNAGTIRGDAGRAITLVGDFADTITNSGTITGGANGAIDMGGGNDTLYVEFGSAITGTIDGGAGIDRIQLGTNNFNMNGSGTLSATSNFESLRLSSGTWRLTGTQAYSEGIDVWSYTTLVGSAATLSQSVIRDDGRVVIDDASDATFTGTILNPRIGVGGVVTKIGAGNLSVGTQSFNGSWSVMEGTLTLTGAQTAFGYFVENGATLTSAMAATLSGAPGAGFVGTTLTNNGTVRNTGANGRVIDLASNGSINLNISNAAGGLIESVNDAIRISGNPTGVNVYINNAGTIRSTNGGQAIDFDAVANGSIEITNQATGIIRATGQDAIRPGQNAVVTNYGLIQSDGAANNSFDGIDWQARSGRVLNQTGGTISGLRHGITSDVAVNVTNWGTIVGRNGSGIGSDGTGTVTNFGTITGRWDGGATNGDGDGVDIDGIGTVRNYGTIEGLTATGVDSGGRPNSAQGVAMGGGTIENVQGASILGGAQGILINRDTNPGGVADGATTISNGGTIRGNAAEGVLLVGDFADTITNSGLIAGNGVALDMGGGNDTLALFTGASFSGIVSGGTGIDRVILDGIGSFGAASGFETLRVNSGSWSLTASSSYAGGITVAPGATLTGAAATLTGSIANAGTLRFDQRVDGSFAGTLAGAGQLIKLGTGTLVIGNQAGFTGSTNVAAGRLLLAGTLPSAVTVASGATLGGSGTVASLTVASGGTVAPGNSPGTIIVTGNFIQAAGSTYVAEITAAGLSDRIQVGGTATIGAGATLAIMPEAGSYAIGTRYTLLTATGGIVGTYTIAQASSGGVELRLVQTGNAIAVDVARSGASLARLAVTSNQAGVAAALAGLGNANAAYTALTLEPDDAVARRGLDALSGEIHATARLAAIRATQAGQEATRSRMTDPASGSGIWGQFAGQSGEDDGSAVAARAVRSGWSVFGGVDFALEDDTRIGIAGGYSRTDMAVAGRASAAEVETRQALIYAGGSIGPIALRSGLGYAWTTTDTRRSISFPGFAAATRANYDGGVLHSFVEAGIARPAFGGTVEPFAGVEFYRLNTDAFAERGGAVALNGGARTESFALSTIGVRGETPIVDGLSARSRLGWQHGFDDIAPRAALRFAGGTAPFLVSGAPLSRDAAVLALDLTWQPTERLTINSGYSGAIGGAGEDNRLRVSVSLGF